MNRPGEVRREAEAPPELESQFILRMPEEPAKVLRDLLQSGANLKDRCSIRLENDMRYGEVRVDHWLMHAKIVDLPTIIESLKTIDNKSFYKTADVCQMMICKEEADQPSIEEETANKNKKKDPFKVEKKFLWPHGVTPPAKNVRKRRFRKTLKKKYVEAPEIEKEVKRLLRSDNDAVSIKWEVLSEEEDQSTKAENAGNSNSEQAEIVVKKEKALKSKQGARTPKRDMSAKLVEPAGDSANVDVEHDIFGGAVSDSDEEVTSNLNNEMNDNSRLSEYDSRLSDSNSQAAQMAENALKTSLPTQFASNMFINTSGDKWSNSMPPGTHKIIQHQSHSNLNEDRDQGLNRESIQIRMEQISAELDSLRNQRIRNEQEVASMENLALKQRFQDIVDNLSQEIIDKEMEYQELQNL